MRRLLEQAEHRFADICWTTASAETLEQHDLDSKLEHSTYAHSETAGQSSSTAAHYALIPTKHASLPNPTAPSDTLIWAHKAILYARATNTFQTRFLNLRAPAAQLRHIGSTASFISLPLHQSESQLSLASNFSGSTQTGTVPTPTTNSAVTRPGVPAKPRSSVRGAAPPSSFSMRKPSLRKPVSRSSISRPLRKGSIDEANSIALGFATSDSEGEGAPTTSLRASRLINTGSTAAASHTTSAISSAERSEPGTGGPERKSSFASVTSTADSRLMDTRSVVSDGSTLRAPISLGGVSPAFFEATLQYLYTGEEDMVNTFDFLFEDRLTLDLHASPEEKLDKLRSDLTFMWRSKLFSDVKLVLGDDGGEDKSDMEGVASNNNGRHRRRAPTNLMDIPDANMSVLSLAQTIDTDRIEDSDTEDDELTSFSTHRMILASRSQYFASLLLSPYADARVPVLHLPSPPFTSASLHFTLGFLYTGTLFFSNRTFDLSTAFSLWRAGAYLQIETLQALVTALIDREFCHGFACSPPCRRCAKRVPRTLAFATSPDVCEQALQEKAIAAVSGAHFGIYWAKDVGNLDPMLQDRIVDSISDRLTQDPTLVVSVLRQLSIVGQRIDTERSNRWVEALRSMAETVENRVMPVLHANLDKIVQSAAWSDLLDGVGFLGDVLEKSLVMLIDGLTEARAAQVYQTLVGQVLLREQGFEVIASREAVETARASILRYLKKRWINVRALSGFNKLEKWCLKEIADELEITTTDLYLAEVPPSVKSTALPGRLMAARRNSSLGGGAVAASAVASGTATTRGSARQSSSLGGAVDSSCSSIISSAPAASPTGTTASPARKLIRDDDERGDRSIHMRAAVLNRNAARTSVANGHRSTSCASASSTSFSAARSSPTPNGAMSTIARAKAAESPPSNIAKPTMTALSTAKTSGVSASVARSATPSAAASSKQQRLRTTSGISVASVASTRSTNSKAAITPTASPKRIPDTVAAARSSPTTINQEAIPPRHPTKLPASDRDKTPTKAIRPVRSATALPRSRPSTGTSDPKPCANSIDSATPTKSAKPPVLAHKSSFLRATPGPGGTFSLSSTSSGADLRARTISNASNRKEDAISGEEAPRARSTTPTRSMVTRTSACAQSSIGSSGRASADRATAEAVGEAMPADAVQNVQRARQASSTALPRRDSTKTIVYCPDPPSEHERAHESQVEQNEVKGVVTSVEGGVSLHVAIACIVALPLGGSASDAGAAGASRPSAIETRTKSFATRPSASLAAGGGKRSTIATSSSASHPKPLPSVTSRASPTATPAGAGAGAAQGVGRKLRAEIRYLGPVLGTRGVWVGITLRVACSELAALGAKSILRLERGVYKGVRYFHPDVNDQDVTQHMSGVGAKEAPRSMERRKQLCTVVSPGRPFAAALAVGQRQIESADWETTGKQKAELVELFVRPHAVVWVVQ